MIRCKKCGQFKDTKKHICPTKVWNKGIPWSEIVKDKVSKSKKGKTSNFTGKKHTKESNLKNSLAHLGKKRSLESRRKQGQSIKGEKSYLWKGGISKTNRTERANFMNTLEYVTWRRFVFKRDNYTCQICGERGGDLRANHIKKYSTYPKLRIEKNNGITICKQCDYLWVFNNEPEWESYFNFNLETRVL